MAGKLKKLWSNQRGVTLIELLAVVVILGIIAAIAAPSVITNFDDAKLNSEKQTQKIVLDAAKRYYLDQKAANAVIADNKVAITDLDNYLDNADNTKVYKIENNKVTTTEFKKVEFTNGTPNLVVE